MLPFSFFLLIFSFRWNRDSFGCSGLGQRCSRFRQEPQTQKVKNVEEKLPIPLVDFPASESRRRSGIPSTVMFLPKAECRGRFHFYVFCDIPPVIFFSVVKHFMRVICFSHHTLIVLSNATAVYNEKQALFSVNDLFLQTVELKVLFL